MIRFILPFLFLFIFSYNASAQESQTTILIEADKLEDKIFEKNEKPLPSQNIQVQGGTGAKKIDSSLNELGIEQENMENLEDVSLERRQDSWLLFKNKKNHSQFQYLSSKDHLNEKIKGRLWGNLFKSKVLLELGRKKDKRKITYIDNKINPYNSTFNYKNSYQLSKNESYGKLQVEKKDLSFLADHDEKKENIHAGAFFTGKENTKQESLNASYEYTLMPYLKGKMAPYFNRRNSLFQSEIDPLNSTQNRNHKWGLDNHLEFKWGSDGEFFKFSPLISQEEMNRKYGDDLSSSFSRLTLKEEFQNEFFLSLKEIRFLKVKSHMNSGLNYDKQKMEKTSKNSQAPFWDLGLSLESFPEYYGGLLFKGRIYEIPPSPTARFGNGSLLLGSDKLISEKGRRLSLGPWLHLKNSFHDFQASFSFFSEDEKNVPLMVGVSPSAAKTLPINGVWTRGYEANLSWNFLQWDLKAQADYVHQNSLNNSSLPWQRGHKIPGRPDDFFHLKMDYSFMDNYFIETGYTYKSEEAYDLNGLWFKPKNHGLDLALAYERESWELKLIGKKLLSQYNQTTPHSSFEGSAAPNLIDPDVEQMEIEVLWEILL